MHRQIKLFLAVQSFFALASGMFGPIYAIFVQNIGGDLLSAGGAWSIFMIVSGVGILLMGQLQDKIKNDKPAMLLGYSLMSLSFLGYYFVANVTQLFLVQILLGIGTVITTPARDSFYTRYLEKGKFASQWSAWEATWFIVAGIAALIGGFLTKLYSFKILFLVMFFTSLIGMFFVMQLREKDD